MTKKKKAIKKVEGDNTERAVRGGARATRGTHVARFEREIKKKNGHCSKARKDKKKGPIPVTP
jgi:hypothetical protein